MKSFDFKQFSVVFNDKVFPVNTDSVILGSLAQFKNPKRLLDVGTGSGLLALMMAQKYPKAEIWAIDVSSDAIEVANMNFRNSPFKNKFFLLKNDFQSFAQQKQFQNFFDGIIINPPYYTNSLLSSNKHTQTQKHNFQFDKFFEGAKKILKPFSWIFMIIPEHRFLEIIYLAGKNEFYNNIQYLIHPNENSSVNFYVIGFSDFITKKIQKNIYIQKNGSFTKEFKQITKDFYLKF